MSSRNGASVANDAAFLSGGGEMARLIGQTDWSKTPLGPIEGWSQSLRTTVSLCLASNFPINIIWGPEHCQIYNDGYRVVCGAAHPQALGEPYTKTWASAWPAIGQPFHHALSGETSFLENQRMFLFRNGYLEETFFTFSLSPIRDESGIGGLFHPVTETTASMLAERRARTLRDLNASLGEVRATRQVFDNALAVLGNHAFDLPFVLLYELDAEENCYRLAGSVGVAADDVIAPATLSEDVENPWSADLAGAREPITVALPHDGAARGPYEEPSHTARVFAITAPDTARAPALMMVGTSSRLPLDEAYLGFLDLLAAALGAGLTSARGYEEARRRAEMLAALDQAKTAFFSNVSHEFRTPLTLMLGPIQDALEADGDLPESQRERLTVAHRNALRLLKLVNSLLDFSRVEAGRSRAVFQPTDLAGLTAELASNFRSACERAGLTLTVDCPPLSQPVNVDREMWEKIVLNLISNAFKFTLDGGITVRLLQTGNRVELAVEDTGLGIAEDQLPRVFERFHRIEGQGGRTHEGSGIGLALVEELAKLHGGAVSVASRLGQGSTFTVSLPLGAAHLPREQFSNRETLVDASRHAEAFVAEAMRWLPDVEERDALTTADAPLIEGRPRVILADDNADMLAYVRRLLEAGGYEVRAVADGQAALDAALEGPPPDLVLSDVMMPRLDGFGLLAALRAEPKLEGLLVILLSARAGEEARVEGLAAGADDYLVKPFSARELRARVDGAVRLARQRREAARREQDLRTEVAAERGRAALLQSQAQLDFALEAGRLGGWEMDIDSNRIAVSPSFRRLFGLGPEDPFEYYQDIVRRVHPGDRDRRHAAVQQAIATGEDLDVEYRIEGDDGAERWVLARGRATYDGDRPLRIAGVTLDITERKAAEARQKLLLAEVDHRAKNTLASVQSIAIQTLRHAESPETFADAFLERIHALSRAHELLTASAWEGADLKEVIARTVRIHLPPDEQDRVSLTGPTIRLGPNAAVTVNMAFHELATNAAKYGAFSTATGRVFVDWSLDAERREVTIDWRETGGPTVIPPPRRGFGSRLLQQGLPRELGGTVDLQFPPEGLRCVIHLPLSAKVGLVDA
ncbi:ATP-binding protein [Caulobacter sp.]|uniref:ATP-binding protein n=1 Tax=Caulobacter sp. TaxID=78 RepID=UPI001B0445FB|nr:ATP-binding protein [Caulobacter sp.]MBO9546319.1 response regulator [Caulobacter sp.]